MRDQKAIANFERVYIGLGRSTFYFGDTTIIADEWTDEDGTVRLRPVYGDQVACGQWEELSEGVERLQEFLWKDGKPFNYSLTKVPRTQDLEPIYCETSGFFIYTKELMLMEHRRVGHKPYLVEITKIEATDIDEPEDFKIANAIYNEIILKEKIL